MTKLDELEDASDLKAFNAAIIVDSESANLAKKPVQITAIFLLQYIKRI